MECFFNDDFTEMQGPGRIPEGLSEGLGDADLPAGAWGKHKGAAQSATSWWMWGSVPTLTGDILQNISLFPGAAGLWESPGHHDVPKSHRAPEDEQHEVWTKHHHHRAT